MFARIGDVLPRFLIYERLFLNHERLIEALSVAYLDIITFCCDAKAVFRRGQRSSSRSQLSLHVSIPQGFKHTEATFPFHTSRSDALRRFDCDLTPKGFL